MILIAEDASNNTKNFLKINQLLEIFHIYFSTKEEIGFAIGKSPRAVVGIKDENFSKKIIELIEI